MKKFFLVLGLILVGCGQAEVQESPTEVVSVESADSTPIPPTATLAPPIVETVAPTQILPTATSLPTLPPPTDEPTIQPTTPPTPEPTIPEAVLEVDDITLPEGFSIRKFTDIERPTGMAFDNNGNLLVTTQNGLIMAYQDTDNDGHADVASQFSFGFIEPLGVAVHPDTGDVYVSSTAKVSILRDFDGDLVADEAVNFVRDLPWDRHKNNNLKFGSDGLLYMGVGSTCDVCYEVDPRSATIMRWDINDPNSGEVFATGLRNPFDLAFHPESGAIFATDNGRDDLGISEPFEELNHIVQGGNYGFPDCWDDGKGTCDGTITAVGFFEARSSANSLEFYTGEQFPAEYHNNLFVSVFGSWVNEEIRRGIWRVQLTPNGETYTTELSWFADWPNHWLLGMTVGPDGALYIGDIFDDAIYRISYGN